MQYEARRSAMTAVIAAVLSLATQSVAAQAATTIDLPAQPLAESIRAIARQGQLNILVDPKLIEGRQAPRLRINATPDAALSLLLAGTGLTARLVDERTIALVAADDPSAPGRAPKNPPASSEARVRPLAQAQAASASSSLGRNSDDAKDADDATRARIELEEIVVTGSRLLRAGADRPAQVIAITRADIDRSGAATARELLNRLPQSAVAMDESGANTFLGASTVQLRGLTVGSTLVLINGRRASAYSESFFDLNSLPLAAIERIEVLTDSASAVYGADAIGGAINFILKKDYDGVDVSLSYGSSSEGGAEQREAALTAGGTSDRYSGLVSLSIYDRKPLLAADRDLTRTGDFSRFGGFDLRSTIAYPANVYSLDGSNLLGLNSSFAGVPAGTDGIGLTPADFAATDGVANLFDAIPYLSVVSESTRVGAFATGEARLASDVRVFAELLYSRNEQLTQSAPDGLFGGAFGLFVVPADNPFNPFGIPVGIDYRFVDIGPRQFDGTMDYSRTLLGVGGSLWERFDWEVSALYDRNEQTVLDRNTVSAFLPQSDALIRQFLSSTDPAVALNVFSSTGNNNPATLGALVHNGLSQSTVEGILTEAIMRGPALRLASGDVQMAVGASTRRDQGSFRPDDAAPLDASKSSWAVFAEAAVPLVAPSWSVPAIHSLEATLAVRRDRYDTFGSEVNPQFGVTWRPVRSLLVRGSYGEAFKAPSLGDLYSAVDTTLTFVPDPLRDNETVDIALVSGGNRDTKPEQARSTTFGVVWEPGFASGLSLAATAFDIQHEDLIVRFFDFNTILSHPELFGARIVRAVPTADDQQAGRPGRLLSIDQTTLNFGSVSVRGADALIRYALPETRAGRFAGQLSGSYIDEYVVELTPDSPPSNEAGKANRAGYPVHFKGAAQLTWSGHAGLGAIVAARYVHSYADYVDRERRIPAQTLWDLQASYEGSTMGMRGLTFRAGIVNLTNEQGSYTNSGLGYDYQQADLRGRFFYVSLEKEF